jgi:hypothetical protein
MKYVGSAALSPNGRWLAYASIESGIPEIYVVPLRMAPDDTVLARHYRFTPEELDFIINYDIKYRMGADDLELDEKPSTATAH